eukprot:PhM_4_TR2058/c0_g1_i1/m.43216
MSDQPTTTTTTPNSNTEATARRCLAFVHCLQQHSRTRLLEEWSDSCEVVCEMERHDRTVLKMNWAMTSSLFTASQTNKTNTTERITLRHISKNVGPSKTSRLHGIPSTIVDSVITYLVHIPTPFLSKVATSNCHVMFVTNNHHIMAAGSNKGHRLGLPQQNKYFTEAVVVPLECTAIGVAAGSTSSYCIDNNGSVWTWGTGIEGELGLGRSVRVTPRATVIHSLRSHFVVSVSASEKHVLAVTHGGQLWAWGNGRNGKLGLGDEENRYEPTRVPIPKLARSWQSEHSSLIVQAAACPSHSLVRNQNGDVFACGSGRFGALGLDTDDDVLSLRPIPGVLDVAFVAGGLHYSLLLSNSGGIYAFGCGQNGRLGLGSETDSVRPRLVQGLPSVRTVAAGPRHAMAISTGGVPFSWGIGASGRLGNGTCADEFKPYKIKDTEEATGQVACGDRHSIFETKRGWMWCGIHIFGDDAGVERSNKPTLIEIQ